MAGIDFLDENEFRSLIKRIERLERAAPVGFSTISRGALVVKSPEGLVVEGSAKVTGTLQVTGTLNADGTITLTGPVTIAGATSVTGNLTVEGGGKIKVGTAMTLDPSISSGAMVFSNGAQVFTDSSSIQIFMGSSVVQVQANSAKIQHGSGSVILDDAGVHVYGLSLAVQNNLSVGGTLTNAGMPLKAGATPNVYVDGVGKVWRTN